MILQNWLILGITPGNIAVAALYAVGVLDRHGLIVDCEAAMTTASRMLLVEIVVMILIPTALLIERAVPYRWRPVASVIFFATGVAMFLVCFVLALVVTNLAN